MVQTPSQAGFPPVDYYEHDVHDVNVPIAIYVIKGVIVRSMGVVIRIRVATRGTPPAGYLRDVLNVHDRVPVEVAEEDDAWKKWFELGFYLILCFASNWSSPPAESACHILIREQTQEVNKKVQLLLIGTEGLRIIRDILVDTESLYKRMPANLLLDHI